MSSAKLALPHKIRVMRLYRHSLKNLWYWIWDREPWYKEARKVRQEFEANKNINERSKIERLLAEGEARLKENKHPDPYRCPYMYGSTLYARNPPFPKEIKYHMDFNRETPFWH